MTFKGRTFEGRKCMDSICQVCGERYGEHFGDDCPERETEPVLQTHYICYVEGTDGGRRYRHYTLQSAQTEAERLARLTGVEVYIYEWKGTCKTALPPVSWEMPYGG